MPVMAQEGVSGTAALATVRYGEFSLMWIVSGWPMNRSDRLRQ
jgi:hypothetical protein